MILFTNNYEKIRQDNIDESVKLTVSDYHMIDRMMKYISSHNVSLFELEIIKKDLIGMAKSAEISDISLEQILGISEKEFCDNLIDDAIEKNAAENALLIFKKVLVALCIWNTLLFFCFGCPKDFGIFLDALIYAGVFVFFEEWWSKKIQGKFLYNRNYKRINLIFKIAYILVFVLWLSLPFDGPFLIKGNGWAITVSLLVFTVIVVIGNNCYWNRQSEKYRWK